MFNDFTRQKITTRETTINIVHKGSGYPVLLLHGYPQTHVCWHLVAPALAEYFTVVCADLRGCGDSGKPQSDAKHTAYSKRTMAEDLVEVMEKLGYNEFAVVGHDRGARIAHRMALDHSTRIRKLVLLDIVPTSWAFTHVDKEIATAAFNWFFSIQSDGLPEKLITAERAFYIQWLLDDFAGKKAYWPRTLSPNTNVVSTRLPFTPPVKNFVHRHRSILSMTRLITISRFPVLHLFCGVEQECGQNMTCLHCGVKKPAT